MINIPNVAFGTWQLQGEECYNAVLKAILYGYKHIDTAMNYGNEKEIARAIKDSKVKRENLFITSKLPAEIKNYEDAKKSIEESLSNLETDYLDLYLIHAPWPWSEVGKNCDEGNIEVWKCLIEYQKMGKLKNIGVSNFHPHDIQNIYDATGVWPVCNQIRYFIGNTQDEIVNYCNEHNILIEAYSPLATGELVNNEHIVNMAKRLNISTVKLCLSYVYTKGYVLLVKSKTDSRIKENLDNFMILSDEDMKYLDSLKHIASTRTLRS